MKTLLGTLSLIMTLNLTACMNPDDSSDGDYCVAMVQYNVANSQFDGSVLQGKQFKLKANGTDVFDTCDNTIDSNYGFNWSGLGYPTEIRRYIDKFDTLPTSDIFEILVRDDCSSVETSIGTATANYNFIYHPKGSECALDFNSSEQNIVFQ